MTIKLLGDFNDYNSHALSSAAVTALASQWTLSCLARFESFGTTDAIEIMTIYDNPTGLYVNKGVSVQITSAGVLQLVTGDGTTNTTTTGINLVTGINYWIAVERTNTGTLVVWTRRVNEAGDAAIRIISPTAVTVPAGMTHFATQTRAAGQAYWISQLRFASHILGNLSSVHTVSRVPDINLRIGKLLHRLSFNRTYENPNATLKDSASNASAYNGTSEWSSNQHLVMVASQAKHKRRIKKRATVARPVVSTFTGTLCGAPAAVIQPPTQPIVSTGTTTTAATAAVTVERSVAATAATNVGAATAIGASAVIVATASTATAAAVATVAASAAISATAATTTAATAALSVERSLASTAATNAGAATAIGTTRAVASTASTATAATAAVTASATVSATAATTTAGTAQAGSGVSTVAATTTGASAGIDPTYPVVSVSATTAGAAARLVAPVVSVGGTTAGASATVGTSRAVASTAGTTAAAAAAVTASSAVLSVASTASTAQAASVGAFTDVVSTAATNAGAVALALAAARAVNSTARTDTGAPGAGVGVVVISPILSSYAGAADTFCRAPTAKITVGLTVPPNPRKREWPYHPR